MTIEQMTPEEEVKLRLAAGISPSTSTEYMLRHIPLWVKMSILRRNSGVGGGGGIPPPKKVTTYNFTTNTYRENGSTVSLGDISEFIRLSSATMWVDGQLVEVANNIPRIGGDGLLIEPQSTNTMVGGLERFTQRNVTLTPTGDGEMYLMQTVSSDTLVQVGLTLYPRIPSNNRDPYSVSLVVKEGTYKTVRVGVAHSSYATLNMLFDLQTQQESTQYPDRIKSTEFVEVGGDGKYLVGLAPSASPNYRDFNIFMTDYAGLRDQDHWIRPDGSESLYVGYPQIEPDNILTSYIPTHGTSATRAPDILNIPLLPTQSIAGEWDAGVTYEVADNIATFAGHGYIRNITVEEL